MHIFDKFLHSISVVLLQNQLLGTTTLTISNRKFQKSKPRTIFILITMSLFLVFAALVFYQKIYLANNTVLYKSTDVILIIINSIYVIAVWLHALFNSDKFSHLLNAIITFDRNLYQFGDGVDYTKQRKRDLLESTIRYTVVVFTVVSFLVIRVYMCEEELLFELLRDVLLLIKSVTCHQAVQLVSIIKTRLEILNKHLRELLDSEDNPRRKNGRKFKTLCKICDMHHHLIKINKLFNKTFGMLLLVMFGLSFVTTVLCFFYISASVQTAETDWQHGTLAIILSIPFLGDVVYVCNVCYKTVEEVFYRSTFHSS